MLDQDIDQNQSQESWANDNQEDLKKPKTNFSTTWLKESVQERIEKKSIRSFEMSQDNSSSMNTFSLNNMSACSDAEGNANLKVTVHIDQEYEGTQSEASKADSFHVVRAHGVLDQDG